MTDAEQAELAELRRFKQVVLALCGADTSSTDILESVRTTLNEFAVEFKASIDTLADRIEAIEIKQRNPNLDIAEALTINPKGQAVSGKPIRGFGY